MAEELRIVVTDQGSTGAGGRERVDDAVAGRGSAARSQGSVPSQARKTQTDTFPRARAKSVPRAAAPGGLRAAASSVRDSLVARGSQTTLGRLGIAAGLGGGFVGASALGIAGGVVAAGALAAGAVTAGGRILGRQVRELSGLSAPLAQAVAESELSSFLDSQRRANRIGGQLASFERTRNRLGSAISDVNTELLRGLLIIFQELKPTLEFLAEKLEALAEFLSGRVFEDALSKGLERLAASLPDHLGFLRVPLEIMAKAMRRVEQELDKQQDGGLIFDQFISQLQRPVSFWPDDQARPIPGGPLIPEGL